jgi:hypothetical protein
VKNQQYVITAVHQPIPRDSIRSTAMVWLAIAF